MKAESCASNKQVLKMEVAVLKRLQKSSSHICEFIGCGRNNKVNYVVMSLVGPNLSELRKHQPNQRFSISTALRVGVQIIAAIQSMHDCGFLHRDVKPSNFAIGDTPETSRTCYMLDYGLARQYTTVTGEVRQPRPVAGFRGTVRYASLNAHLSRDLGRHDDLWSVFYLLVELAIGHLPWRRIRDKEEAGEFKAKYDHRKLIRSLPNEFLVFLEHLKTSSYYDKPDYQLVLGCMQDAISRLGIQEADLYDWEQDISAPSVTTASMISPPAVKLVNEDDAHSPMRTLQTSKTNCSGVGDLSENAQSEPKHLNLTVPQSFTKRLPFKLRQPYENRHKKSKDSNVNAIESIPENSKLNPSKPNQAPVILGEDLFECVPPEDLNIVNRYVSDEEEGGGEERREEVFGDANQQASKELPMELEEEKANGIQHGSTHEGVVHVKSYQTESLNRFYDLGAKGVRESVVSYKSFSRKSNDREQLRRESHVSSQYFSKTSQSSEQTDILNNAIIYPEKSDDFGNAFEAEKEVDPVSPPAFQEGDQKLKDDSIEEPKSKSVHSVDSPESDKSDQSSEKLTKVLLLHKLLMKSSSSQSESTRSIEVLFAQKTNLDLVNRTTGGEKEHKVGESSGSARHKNQKGIPVHRTSPELYKRGHEVQDSEDVEAVDTGVEAANSPLQLSVSEHTGKENKTQLHVKQRDHPKAATNFSDGRKTRSASNFLEVHPQQVRIHPRPPPNPPPLNYSVSLMARRRRFVRTKAKSKKP